MTYVSIVVNAIIDRNEMQETVPNMPAFQRFSVVLSQNMTTNSENWKIQFANAPKNRFCKDWHKD